MTEKLVQFRADFHDPRRRLVLDDHVPDLVAVHLPVRLRDRYGAIQPRLHFESLEHKQGFSQVAIRVSGDFANNAVVVYPEILTRGDVLHDFHHL